MNSTPSRPRRERLAILGLGLIGGSIGLALRERGYCGSIVGWDPDTTSLTRAHERRAIDEVAGSAQQAVREAEMVVLCPPLPSTLPLLETILPALPLDATVTDVGSLKAQIAEAADRLLPGRFVGGHPMAGSEASGIDSARANLFLDAPWLMTPTPQTEDRAAHAVEQFVQATGANPRICEPVEHDRIVAALSHLPHLLAFGLTHAAAELVPEQWRNVAAGSFRDGTRVAAADPDLWQAVFEGNRASILDSLAAFEAWTEGLKRALLDGDPVQARALIAEAGEAKQAFSKANSV